MLLSASSPQMTEIGSREIGVAVLVAHSGVLRAFGSRGSVVP
jgi:hypothetical protein